MRTVLAVPTLVVCVATGVLAQSFEVIPWKPSPVIASEVTAETAWSDRAEISSGSVNALFTSDMTVFPHLATGGGWETVMVIVNMSAVTVQYSTYFYDQQGRPMTITFRNFPQGQITTATAIRSTLTRGSSFNFSLFDSTVNTQIGWAVVEVATPDARVGGYAVFRQKIAGRPDFEALVPLSSYDDYKFFLPIDEFEGFITAMAICNPGGNLTTTVLLQVLGLDGLEIARKSITLAPGQHRAFAIVEEFPQMAGRLGTLYVEGTSNRLSAIGIRFNTRGGNSFSSVPIMNWLGMF